MSFKNQSPSTLQTASALVNAFPETYPVPLKTPSFTVELNRGRAVPVIGGWGVLYGPKCEFRVDITEKASGFTFSIRADEYLDGLDSMFMYILKGEKPKVKRKGQPKNLQYWAACKSPSPELAKFLSEADFTTSVEALRPVFKRIADDFKKVAQQNHLI